MRQLYVTIDGKRAGPYPADKVYAALQTGKLRGAKFHDAETGEHVPAPLLPQEREPADQAAATKCGQDHATTRHEVVSALHANSPRQAETAIRVASDATDRLDLSVLPPLEAGTVRFAHSTCKAIHVRPLVDVGRRQKCSKCGEAMTVPGYPVNFALALKLEAIYGHDIAERCALYVVDSEPGKVIFPPIAGEDYDRESYQRMYWRIQASVAIGQATFTKRADGSLTITPTAKGQRDLEVAITHMAGEHTPGEKAKGFVFGAIGIAFLAFLLSQCRFG
jgi:hypothetical protein